MLFVAVRLVAARRVNLSLTVVDYGALRGITQVARGTATLPVAHE